MNGNCGVCGLKASCICPEHGERCDAHVPTHAYCPQLRPMCVSCGAPVPEGGEGVPELCGGSTRHEEPRQSVHLKVSEGRGGVENI